MRQLVFVLALSACRISADHYTGLDNGDDADPGDDGGAPLPSIGHSGSRLQIVQYAFPDGAKLPIGIHDSQLGASCGASVLADGGTYCVPFQGNVRFSDSNCTMRLISPFNASMAGPVYATDRGRVYLAGAPTTVSQAFILENDRCRSTNSSGLRAVAREVLPSELVAMTVTPDDQGPYSERYVHGADGLLTIENLDILHDKMHGIECFVNSQGPGWPQSYCIPNNTTFTGTYADDRCTQPIALDTSPTTAFGAVFAEPGTCFVIDRIRPVGPSVGKPAQTYSFDSATGQCTARGAATQNFVSLGAATELPRFDYRPVAQPGRRLENGSIVGGGQRFWQRDFFDTTLGTRCFPRFLPDGQIACLPEAPAMQTVYRDAACTQSLAVANWTQTMRACGIALPAYAIEQVGNTIHVRPALEPASGQLYRSTPTCEQVPVGGNDFFFALGDPLPLSMFAIATVVTEPTQ